MNTVASLPDRLAMHARDCVKAADMGTDVVLSFQQIEAMADDMEEAAAALATPEQPGSAVQGEKAEAKLANAGVFKGHHGLRGLAEADAFWDRQMYGTRLYYGDGGMDYLHRSVLRAAVELLDTTTPPAPAAEQGDALALLREIRATGVGLNEHWLARVDAVLANATQPEARGVEGKWVPCSPSLILAGVDCAKTPRRPCYMNHEHFIAHATSNPVRAEQPDCRCVDCGGDQPKHDPTCSYMRELTGEQPEVQGDDPGRMAIRLLVAAGHVTEAKANEALCIAHGFEPGPLAPAAPVGVDGCEWTLDDDDDCAWRSACGEYWTFIDGTPEDNNCRFCHNCGKPVSIAALAGKEGA